MSFWLTCLGMLAVTFGSRLAGLLATRLDPEDVAAQDLLRLGEDDESESESPRRAADYTDR